MNTRNVMIALCAVGLLGACSTVGPGFAHHPADCALGIKWADCLPETPGYNNGGGQQTRAEEAKKQNEAIRGAFQPVIEQCKSDLATPDLDPIRRKVELYRDAMDAPVPFEIASNDTFPTDSERALIAKRATLRDDCTHRSDAVSNIPPSANAMQVAFLQQQRSFSK